MSESKTEIGEDSKTTDNENVGDKKSKKAKTEITSKKAKKDNEENETPEELPSEGKNTKTTKTEKSKKLAKKKKIEEPEEDRKIPLLDQPTIVEGSRTRKCVLKPEPPKEIIPGYVIIPEGNGKALGKIPVINARLKRLRFATIKALHRLIFGRIGNVKLLLNNIQKFKGFPFAEDSDEYNRKLTVLHKFQMSELKELTFSFDLDMKLKKKDECIKAILNFLILPKESEQTHNPSPINHPKRKATKRNYFDADMPEEETKKRKKPKIIKEVKKEENSVKEKETKSSTRTPKTNDKNKNVDTSKEEDQENNSELKKPAKKRKRNQIIEDEETDKSKNQDQNDAKKDEKTNQEDSEPDSAIEDDDKPLKKKDDGKDKLSDEELRNFLKKVLADLNLESTTMKTVYNLISSEYPNYDFSKKKRFIKGVVKSLIQ